jgi:TolA-binding protein
MQIKSNINCPSNEELSRAFSEGANDSVKAHLSVCPDCRNALQSFARLVDLGQDLPYEEPSADRIENVRLGIYIGALASQSQTSKRHRMTRMFSIAAATVAILLSVYFAAVAIGVPESPEIYRAQVAAMGDAVFTLETAQPDEVVRLVEGTISVNVDKLEPGERFRVLVGDSQVEVRGTSFTVEAEQDRLLDVHVFSGRVVVNQTAASPVTLDPKESLMDKQAIQLAEVTEPAVPDSEVKLPAANQAAAIKTPSSKTPIAKTSVAATEITPESPIETAAGTPTNTIQRSAAQTAFETGWSALKSGNYGQAADAFDRALKASGTDPIAEDSAYWLGISLSYAGKSARAETAMREFVRRYPGSPRAGEASVALGWMLFDRGDLTAARSQFSSALNDRVGKVRASAGKGLEAVQAQGEPGSETDG